MDEIEDLLNKHKENTEKLAQFYRELPFKSKYREPLLNIYLLLRDEQKQIEKIIYEKEKQSKNNLKLINIDEFKINRKSNSITKPYNPIREARDKWKIDNQEWLDEKYNENQDQ